MARKWEWQLVGGSKVDVTIGAFGKVTVAVDGRSAGEPPRCRQKVTTFPITLPNNTVAELEYAQPFGSVQRCDLRLSGQVVLPQKAPKGVPTQLTACPACKAQLAEGARFCDACGQRLPTPEELNLEAEVTRSNDTVGALSILFVIAGLVMFVIQRMQANKALETFAGVPDAELLAEPIPGVAATVGELRERIQFESFSLLGINLLLAAIMFGLWRWGKRKPSAAITAAFCTYVAVIGVSMALEPASIAQGWIVKLVVLVSLVRGLKAAIALRNAKSRA